MTEIIYRELTPEEIAEREAWAAEAPARELEEAKQNRRSAYQLESDPLFFQFQRGVAGVTEQDWLDKVAEIDARYPYPAAPKK